RDIAVAERIVAEVDLARRALAELALDLVFADALHRRGQRASASRARRTAASTCSGAVPPGCEREATEPSSVSTRNTSLSIEPENLRSSSSDSSDRSRADSSAKRTALPTASWASRKATPLRTR